MRLLIVTVLLCFFTNSFFAQTQAPIKKLPQKGKLNLLVHPADQLVCEDMPVVFRAFAACPAPEVPQYQWQSSADGLHWDDIAGATAAEYSGIGLAKRAHNASQFRVCVQGGGESICSFPAQLLVESGLYFTERPEKQTATEGSVVEFMARAESESGNGVASYQWQYSPYASGIWTPLAGENKPVLRIANVNSNMNGNSYRLLSRTFNGCDSAVSAPGFLAVAGRPVVSVLPVQKSLCGGGDATFSVQIQGGNGKETYQWQVSHSNSREFEDMAGEKSNAISVTQITPAMDGWRYRAKVKLSDGTEVISQPSSLTVHGTVAFSQQPKSMSTCMGEPAGFVVGASFEGKTPEYWWQSSADNGSSWQDLAGANSDHYNIAFTTPDLNGRLFRARAASGECGGAVFSATAKITVFSDVQISQQPRDAKVTAVGSPAIFEAAYVPIEGGDYSVTWEWSATGGSTWQYCPGGKGETLTLARTTADMADYLYRMKILDKRCGRISYSDAARILF